MTNAELDALIAERVMGWTSPKAEEGSGLNDSTLWFGDKSETGYSRVYYSDRHEIWHPTEDISQAMQAVEKMFELGWMYAAESTRDGNHWFCVFKETFMDDDIGGPCSDKSLSLAICKAIASAIGEAA